MISVVIPIYNAENSVEKALNSIKNQTWKGDFEIIIINDGSSDKSKIIAENFIKDNSELNIKLINQENGGVSKARNAALKMANGDYIALLDADDEWFPEKTERQMSVFENENFDIDFLGTRRKNHTIHYPYKVGENNLIQITFRKLMFRNETQPSTVIFKRKILENTGFFNDLQRSAEDINYWLKIAQNNKMYILNDELLLAGNGKRSFGISGLSGNLQEMEKGFQKNLKEMLKLKRINISEYILYFLFYRMKYAFRLSRHKFLKLQGK